MSQPDSREVLLPGISVKFLRYAHKEDGGDGVPKGSVGTVKEWVDTPRASYIRVETDNGNIVKVKLTGGGSDDQIRSFFEAVSTDRMCVDDAYPPPKKAKTEHKMVCKVNEVTKIAFGKVPKCHRCECDIPKGHLRFGFAPISSNGKEGWSQWWHIGCVGAAELAHISNAGGLEKAHGWDGLSEVQRAEVASTQKIASGCTTAAKLATSPAVATVQVPPVTSSQDLLLPGTQVKLLRYAHAVDGGEGVAKGGLGVVKEWTDTSCGSYIFVEMSNGSIVKVKMKGGGHDDQVKTFFAPADSDVPPALGARKPASRTLPTEGKVRCKVNEVTKIAFGNVPKCQKCERDIHKGQLRFGFAKISSGGKEGWTSWWHVTCICEHELAQLVNSGGVERADGWETLSTEQQGNVASVFHDRLNGQITPVGKSSNQPAAHP